MVTGLSLPTVEVWRSYRERADCENRIKELKEDFGLDSFNRYSFYAIEAALAFAMLAYNLMSTFQQAVVRQDTAYANDAAPTGVGSECILAS